MPLTNTASAHSKSSLVAATDILVDEADLPVRRQIGRDQQQPLRRHEGLDAVGQGIGVLERTERRRVARKHAQDAPCGLVASQLSSNLPRQADIAAEISADTCVNAATRISQDCGSNLMSRERPMVSSAGAVGSGRVRRSAVRQNRAAGLRRRQAGNRRPQAPPAPASRRIPARASGRTRRGHRARRGTRSTGSSA